MLSANPDPPPPPPPPVTSDPSRAMTSDLSRTMTSDPRRRVAMETYWREVQSIEEEQEEEEQDERKSLDELELEEAWLVESGLSALTQDQDQDQVSEDSRPVEALLSTLTRRQTDTVRRRLDNYTQTLRQRNRPIRDVRHIFTQTEEDLNSEPVLAPVRCDSPTRFHSTTKTIRRHNARVRPPVRPSLPVFIVEDPPSPLSPASPAQTLPPEPCRAADWLLRDTPYSEGVAEHKRGGACLDCACFHDGDNEKEATFLSGPVPGLSSAEDLSDPDLTSIGFISHIELHTFLQTLGQNPTKTRSPRRRHQDSGVFGVPLKTLLENDRKKFPEIKTPLVFHKLLSVLDQTGLQTEGILRISGSVARLKSLRRDLDRCSSDFDWSGLRAVDAAGLLKLFIRELPTPLLYTHPQTYRAVMGLQSEVHQVQALQLLCLILPESHRHTLQALLWFLSRVVSNQDQNRMSLWNVSMVMAPNLLHGNRSQEVTREVTQEMEEAVGGAKLVRLLIRHRDLMWTVPCFLLAQVRQMNQASNQKRGGLARTKRRLQQLRRNQDQNQDYNQVSLCDDVIRVRAPLQLKVSTAMKLDTTTTARDVTERFHHEHHSGAALRLYEVGGNIGERRLHPDCFLLDVYRVNPGCDWLIKP